MKIRKHYRVDKLRYPTKSLYFGQTYLILANMQVQNFCVAVITATYRPTIKSELTSLNALSSVNYSRVFYIFTYFFLPSVLLVIYSCLSPYNDFSEYLTKNICKISFDNKTI